MRSYIITSASLFALLVLAHVARLIAEGTGPLAEIPFIASSLVALAMVAWGIVLLRRK